MATRFSLNRKVPTPPMTTPMAIPALPAPSPAIKEYRSLLEEHGTIIEDTIQTLKLEIDFLDSEIEAATTRRDQAIVLKRGYDEIRETIKLRNEIAKNRAAAKAEHIAKKAEAEA